MNQKNRNNSSKEAVQKSPRNERERLILERILSLKQFIEVDGGEGRDFHELGICYYFLRNYEQAVSYLEELFASFPNYPGMPDAKALHVFCTIRAGHFRKAIGLVEGLLKGNGEDLRLLAMKAYCIDKLGDAKEAIALHRSILARDPENTNSLNSLGYLLTLHGGPEERHEAARYLKQALEKCPNSPAYLDSLGVLLMKEGNRKSAQKALSRALRLNPESSDILTHYRELLKGASSAP